MDNMADHKTWKGNWPGAPEKHTAYDRETESLK